MLTIPYTVPLLAIPYTATSALKDHESYNKLPQTPREREVFSLKGPELRSRRMHIYKFMLEHMPDDQRFQMSHKLCQDILGENSLLGHMMWHLVNWMRS